MVHGRRGARPSVMKKKRAAEAAAAMAAGSSAHVESTTNTSTQPAAAEKTMTGEAASVDSDPTIEAASVDSGPTIKSASVDSDLTVQAPSVDTDVSSQAIPVDTNLQFEAAPMDTHSLSHTPDVDTTASSQATASLTVVSPQATATADTNTTSQAATLDSDISSKAAAANTATAPQSAAVENIVSPQAVALEPKSNSPAGSVDLEEESPETAETFEDCKRHRDTLLEEYTKLKYAKDVVDEQLGLTSQLLSEKELEQYEQDFKAKGIENEKKQTKKQWQYAFDLKEKRIKRLETLLESTEARRALAHNGYTTAKSMTQSLRHKERNLQARVEAMDKENGNLKAELDELKKKLAASLITISEKQTFNDSLTNETQRLTNDFSELQKSANEVLQAELNARRDAAKFSSTIEALEKENLDLKKANDALRRRSENRPLNRNLQQEIEQQNMSDEARGDIDQNITTESGDFMTAMQIPEKDNATKIDKATQTAFASASVAIQTIEAPAEASMEAKKAKSQRGTMHWFFIVGTILLLLMAAFALYHGLQARAERAMWLGANDYSRRAVIYYRAAAERGERVPWMTAAGIQKMKTGYGGGFKRGGVEL